MLTTEKEEQCAFDRGLVSIIMPNYNSQEYVQATIQSVLAQTYKNWELIFSDDGSTDRTVELVKAFEDPRIKLLCTEKNSGAAVARNAAIEAARGKWIAFLDSDDLWAAEKLEKQLAFMEENHIDFSYTDYDVIDTEGNLLSSYRPQRDVCGYKDILGHNCIGCLTVIYNAEKLGKVYMPTDAVKREDWACWLRILKQGTKAYCLHETLAQYKLHSNSVSSSKLNMLKYQWRVYRKVEKLNMFEAFYYLALWAVMGVFKYR